MPLLLRQSAIQISAAGLALIALLVSSAGAAVSPLLWVAMAGAVAWVIAWRLDEAPWWRWTHLAFAPLAYALLVLDLPPAWYAVAFLACFAVFGQVQHNRVPLFLSNALTAQAVANLLPEARPATVTDLGAGIGSVLFPVAKARHLARCTGVEHAPLPFLAGWVRSLRHSNARMRWGDLWRYSLAETDLLYLFLSPAPMADIWAKACREMPAGSRVVSNSFAIPGVAPERILSVADRRQTRLYLYRIPARAV